MYRVQVCGWFLQRLVAVFGMETFAVAAAISLPEPVLVVLEAYMKEIPI